MSFFAVGILSTMIVNKIEFDAFEGFKIIIYETDPVEINIQSSCQAMFRCAKTYLKELDKGKNEEQKQVKILQINEIMRKEFLIYKHLDQKQPRTWNIQAIYIGAHKAIVSGKTPMMSSLSNREQTILDLLIQGFSNQEIAERLYISKNTVDVHRGNIYKKFGVNSFQGLYVAYYRRNGNLSR